MEQWVAVAVALVGAPLGAYVGVRVAVAKLEVQMIDVRAEIERLRQRAHDNTNALLKLDGRVSALERAGKGDR